MVSVIVHFDSTNNLALRLMHHYTQASTFSRVGNPSSAERHAMIRALWEEDIPRIAFFSETVMAALLGISAWHLWALNPDDREMAVVSRSYFGKAVKLQRTALNELDKNRRGRRGHSSAAAADSKKLEILSIAGLILAHHNWVLGINDGQSSDSFIIEMETFHMCEGFRHLIGENSSFPWASSVASGDTSSSSSSSGSPPYEQAILSPARIDFMGLALSDSDRLLDYIAYADIDEEGKDAHRKGVQVLLEICSLIVQDLEDVSIVENAIITFLHRLPPRYASMLEQYDPIALAIYARIMAMLHLLDDTSSWWIHGVGNFRADLTVVMGVRSFLGSEWSWITDWPLQIVSDQVMLH